MQCERCLSVASRTDAVTRCAVVRACFDMLIRPSCAHIASAWGRRRVCVNYDEDSSAVHHSVVWTVWCGGLAGTHRHNPPAGNCRLMTVYIARVGPPATAAAAAAADIICRYLDNDARRTSERNTSPRCEQRRNLCTAVNTAPSTRPGTARAVQF